jgi:hypothetical protein
MSNSIEVEIVPAEPEWQRRQLERILQVLPPVQLRLTAPQKAAVRALTYLGTAEALEAIQNRLAAGSSSMDLTWRFARSFLLQMTAHEPVK